MKIRTLEDVCEQENFSIELLGNTYCRLKMGEKIGCKYQSDMKDQNKMYQCMHPFYNNLEYMRLRE